MDSIQENTGDAFGGNSGGLERELRFSRGHQWVERRLDGTLRIGITPRGLVRMGDLVFVDLLDNDENLEAGEAYGELESVRAVWDVYSPVGGKVRQINREVLLHPEEIKENPYAAWLLEVEAADADEFSRELMDGEAYAAFVRKEEEQE
ncbi:MAG: glycine cleavage system protein H [Peptococcaceae bacterium]|nr:glycine cleavage system protein H [Peptococcaceae bacterium]